MEMNSLKLHSSRGNASCSTVTRSQSYWIVKMFICFIYLQRRRKWDGIALELTRSPRTSPNASPVLHGVFGKDEGSMGWKTSKLREGEKEEESFLFFFFFLTSCLLTICQSVMETTGVLVPVATGIRGGISGNTFSFFQPPQNTWTHNCSAMEQQWHNFKTYRRPGGPRGSAASLI